jgi:hypothetical protein
MEQLYRYLASAQFAQRMRTMLEGFEAMRTDLEAEKRAMQRIWAKRQTQIERVTGSMTNVVGELQAIAQDQLPRLNSAMELDAIGHGRRQPINQNSTTASLQMFHSMEQMQ